MKENEVLAVYRVLLWLCDLFVIGDEFGLNSLFVFLGVGSIERRCKRVQIDWSSTCEAGFGRGECECAQENWIYLGWIVCFWFFSL